MTTTLLRSTVPAGRAYDVTRRADPLDQLSPRELDVLALMAVGRSNRAIAEQLAVELKTVETHVGRVFTKLGLSADRYENRRVLAVLAYFGSAGVPSPASGFARASIASRSRTA